MKKYINKIISNLEISKKWEIEEEKKLMKKIVILAIVSFFTILFSLLLDVLVKEYGFIDFIMYFTALNNILVFVYCISHIIYGRNRILLLMLPSIILIGIAFMVFAFIPYFIMNIIWTIKPNGIWIIDAFPYKQNINPIAFLFISIPVTLMLHFVVPLLSYMFLKNEFKKFNATNFTIMINIIWLIAYWVYVETIILIRLSSNIHENIGLENTPYPYFFLNIWSTEWWKIIGYISINFGLIFLSFVIVNFLDKKWIFDKKDEKNSNQKN